MANAKKGKVTGKKVAAVAGAGIAAAAAAGAGYYFYFGKQAKAHRRVAAKWATDLKKEVVKQAKKAKTVERHAVAAIVDQAAAAYRGAKSVDAGHLVAAAAELKENWHEIARELKAAGRGTKALAAGAMKKARVVTATAKKKAVATVKKAVKKTVKKPSRR